MACLVAEGAISPYRRPVPRVLWGSTGGGRFLMGEVPLHCSRFKGACLVAEGALLLDDIALDHGAPPAVQLSI